MVPGLQPPLCWSPQAHLLSAPASGHWACPARPPRWSDHLRVGPLAFVPGRTRGPELSLPLASRWDLAAASLSPFPPDSACAPPLPPPHPPGQWLSLPQNRGSRTLLSGGHVATPALLSMCSASSQGTSGAREPCAPRVCLPWVRAGRPQQRARAGGHGAAGSWHLGGWTAPGRLPGDGGVLGETCPCRA